MPDDFSSDEESVADDIETQVSILFAFQSILNG